MEPKEQNIQIGKLRQIHKYKEHFDGFQKGGPVDKLDEKVEVIKKYKLAFTTKCESFIRKKHISIFESCLKLHA